MGGIGHGFGVWFDRDSSLVLKAFLPPSIVSCPGPCLKVEVYSGYERVPPPNPNEPVQTSNLKCSCLLYAETGPPLGTYLVVPGRGV